VDKEIVRENERKRRQGELSLIGLQKEKTELEFDSIDDKTRRRKIRSRDMRRRRQKGKRRR